MSSAVFTTTRALESMEILLMIRLASMDGCNLLQYALELKAQRGI
jgi:hypothetical protein